MTYRSGSAPSPKPGKGLPGWAKALLILLAMLIIVAGICTAIATSSL
jgi:hypothetical protein